MIKKKKILYFKITLVREISLGGILGFLQIFGGMSNTKLTLRKEVREGIGSEMG